MKSSELLRKLKHAGWEVIRQGKGSHVILGHADFPGKAITFPDHGSQEISKGLENAILKQAGLK